MPLSTKIQLPDAFIQELDEYVRISKKYNRTTSGQATFTNTDTSATYDTTGTTYDNQGEAGLALLLYNENPILKTYIYADEDYDLMKDYIEDGSEIKLATVVSQELQFTIPSWEFAQNKFFKVEIPSDVSGGNITVKVNTDTALELKDEDDANVTSLDAGYYTFIAKDDTTDFFLLASPSSGAKAWLQQYDGTNAVLKDEKDKDITVKTDQYVNNEFYETKIQGDGSELLDNPDYNIFGDIAFVAPPSGNATNGVYNPTNNTLYYRNSSSPYQLLSYNLTTSTWDDTLTSPPAQVSTQPCLDIDNQKIYIRKTSSPYNLYIYDIALDTWDTSSAPGSDYAYIPNYVVDGKIYANRSSATYFLEYDIVGDSWSSSLAQPTVYVNYTTVDLVNKKLYGRNNGTNAIVAYDITGDSWDETLATPGESNIYHVYIDGKVYTRQSASPNRMFIYDIQTDAWDTTNGGEPPGDFNYNVAVDKVIYAELASSSSHITYDTREQVDFQIIPPITQVEPVSKEPVGTATPVDKSTPVQVVNADYDVSGNGGRKIVVLDNGWVVTVSNVTDYYYFHVDKQDGNGFIDLCYVYHPNINNEKFAISTDGTLITLTYGYAAVAYHGIKFDATTIENVNLFSSYYKVIDNVGLSSLGEVSNSTDSKSVTHHTHSCIKSTHPNSKNIFYSKDDGNGNWDAVTQVTTQNTSTFDYKNPSIVINSFGYPVILSSLDISSVPKIVCQPFDGSSWGDNDVYNSPSYDQSNPSASVLSDGTLGCAWQGYGASHASTFHIFIDEDASSEGDGWTGTPTDVAVGENPSLARDDSDNWVITYERSGTIYSKTSADSWTAETTVATGTNPNSATYPYFTDPITVFDGGTDVKLTGVWDSYSEFETIGNNKALIDGTLEMNELVTDNVYNGWVSNENLWKPDMEGANSNPLKEWNNETIVFDGSPTYTKGTTRGVVSGSGWVLGVVNKNTGSTYGMALLVDGSYVIGDASNGIPVANNKILPMMIRYESSFEVFLSNTNLSLAYLEGDDFETATLNFVTDESLSTYTTRVNVTGEGWLYGANFLAQAGSLNIDNQGVKFSMSANAQLPVLLKYHSSLVAGSTSDDILVTYNTL